MTEFERKLLRLIEELLRDQKKSLAELERINLSEPKAPIRPLSSEEVETQYKVSRKTLYRKRVSGDIEARFLGNHAFYDPNQLLKLKPRGNAKKPNSKSQSKPKPGSS